MLLEEEKAAIYNLLTEIQKFTQPANVAAHDYYSLKLQVAENELDEEIQLMLAHLEDKTSDFHETFKILCAERAGRITESCLSLFALPTGLCNKLYWQIAAQLFKPETLGEMFSILLPDIKTFLVPELYLDISREAETWQFKAAAKHPAFRFKEVEISGLRKPAQQEALKNFVAAGSCILDVSHLETLSFDLHESFEKALQKSYPELARKLYQHNKDLKTLAGNLRILSNQGEAPYAVIKHLAQELLLGGEQVTNKVYASSAAEHAYKEFVRYFEALPAPFKEELSKLKTSDGLRSLNDILEHLLGGNCVEQAAGWLASILDNQANQNLLYSRPNFSAEYIQAIKQQYSYKKQIVSMPIKGCDPTTTLPNPYLEYSLTKIVINNADSYFSLLIHFPPNLYVFLLRYAQITCEPVLPPELSEMIEEGIFNGEQLQALNQAIIANYDKLGGFLEVIHFAVRHNNVQLLQQIKALMPDEQFLALIREKDAQNISALYLAASHFETLKFLLNLLPKKICFAELESTVVEGYKAIHWASNTAEALELILRLYPASRRLQAVTERVYSDSLLNLVIENEKFQSLMIIVKLLPKSKRLALLQETITITGDTPFHHLASHPEIFVALLQKLRPSERLIALQAGAKKAGTVIHQLVEKNPETLRLVLQQTPEEERIALVSIENKGKISALSWAGERKPESFKIIWELLPEAARFNTLKQIINPETTFLHLVVRQENSVYIILQTLSEKNCQALLEKRNKQGDTVLHLASVYPKSLAVLLQFYPDKNLITALTAPNDLGFCTLDLALLHSPQSLAVVLERIPKTERLAVLKMNEAKILQLGVSAKSSGYMQVIFRSLFDDYKPLYKAYQDIMRAYSAQNTPMKRQLIRFAQTGKEMEVKKGAGFFPSMPRQLRAKLQSLLDLKPEERSLVAQLFLDSKKIDYSEVRPSSSAIALTF